MLYLGRQEAILEHLPNTFLLLDDGPLIDLYLASARTYTELDFSERSFNPLSAMDDRKARDILSIIDAIFPEGENTLARKNSNHLLLKALLERPRNFEHLLRKLIPKDKKDTAATEAFQKVENLLLSDDIRRVLCEPQNFTARGVLLARLDRSVYGDFVCFALGNFLMSKYQGQIVVPDFGFYQAKWHTKLFRQNRLVAGLRSLSECPQFRERFLQGQVVASGVLYDDAVELAKYRYKGKPDTDGYDTYIKGVMA